MRFLFSSFKSFYPVDERGFTPDQRQILDSQLRKHVQLATQSYIQTYEHPELQTFERAKQYLVSSCSKNPKNVICWTFFGMS